MINFFPLHKKPVCICKISLWSLNLDIL